MFKGLKNIYTIDIQFLHFRRRFFFKSPCALQTRTSFFLEIFKALCTSNYGKFHYYLLFLFNLFFFSSSDVKISCTFLYVVNVSLFQLLQNHCLLRHQTYHKCSFRGPEEVLYLFEVITNPRWLPWILIGQDIFNFFSRTTACEILLQEFEKSLVSIQSGSKSNMPLIDYNNFDLFSQIYSI